MKLYFKRVISFVCVSILIMGILHGFRYILVDDTNAYTRTTINQMYNSEENIDVLFIGSSHCYRSVIPEIMDNYIGKYTFNLGTSSQGLDGTLALIKETIKYHDVSEIYLEMYYAIAISEPYKERTQLTKTYIISDYMKPSLNKIEYLLEASSKEHYSNSFIVARRDWHKFFNASHVLEMLNKKTKETYRNYEQVREEDDVQYYQDRGFVANEEFLEYSIYPNEGTWEELEIDAISEDWKNSLFEIIELCEKKEIELTFFVSPMPQDTLAGKKNYDEYVNIVRSIAEEHEIEYYDFNLSKDEYFPICNYEYYSDISHLNVNGAEKFSELFGSLIAGDISEEELFYDSYEEKLAMQKPMILGIAGSEINVDKGLLQGKIISNRATGMEYRITMVPKGKKKYLVQNFSEENIFTYPVKQHGVVVVEWKYLGDENSEVQTIEFEY